jgi:hypothetical protein
MLCVNEAHFNFGNIKYIIYLIIQKTIVKNINVQGEKTQS